MSQRCLSSTALLFILLTPVFPIWAQSSLQTICGDGSILQRPPQDLRAILRSLPPNFSMNSEFQQCGIPKEDFRVCLSCSSRTTTPMMEAVTPMLASRAHRRWHNIWHGIRGNTEFTNGTITISDVMTPAEDFTEKDLLGTWITGDVKEFFNLHGKGGTVTGEDFLFMHRQMIKMVQLQLAANHQPCMEPWTDILPPDDRDWPVLTGDSVMIDYLHNQGPVLQNLRSAAFLKSVSLNELGIKIEGSLHFMLHLIYMGKPKDASPLCGGVTKEFPIGCDNLGPGLTAPVNRYFWKIHGLIDGLVGEWLEKNGYNEIAVNCENRNGCYQWKGTWIGQVPNLE